MGEPALYRELAPYYDRLYRGKDYAGEARELLARARRLLKHRPRSLLDVACGTGRHLAEFRRAVPDVAGVDLSPAMLRVARRSLGAGLPLTPGDLRTFDLGRTFEVITCLFSAFGYLTTPRDRDRAMARIYAHLVPGGVAMVEGWILPDRWKGRHCTLLTYDGPEVKIARMSESRRSGERSTIEMRYLVGVPNRGMREYSERHENRLLPPGEVLRSFRSAGFEARADLRGRYRDRGLYIGVRPRGMA